ncbi:MAG: peptidoglycan editing factor PgeF, partial [Saezia sp.]
NIQHNKNILTSWLRQEGLDQGEIHYFNQVHGTHALNLDEPSIRALLENEEQLPADACYTTTPGVLCAIRTADCMPVLISVPGGVAAIHAGWRGLAAGIVTKTLEKLLQTSKQEACSATVWLGACIGKHKFEVGADVKSAFEQQHPDNSHAFNPIPDHPQHWLADLLWLAQTELKRAGVQHIYTDGRCTVTDEHLFFSYRRDQKKLGGTGQMMTCIWMDNH